MRAPPLRHRWTRLIAIALVMRMTAPGFAATEGITLVPLWGGVFVNGAATELAVIAISDRGGAGRIQAVSDDASISVTPIFEAERPLITSLPVRPGRNGRVAVLITLPDGTVTTETVWYELSRQPLRIRDTAPTQLPRTLAGYGPVEALSLSLGTLTGLDQERTAALAAYLGMCRPLAVPEASDAMLDAIRASAGCAGRAIGRTLSPSSPTFASKFGHDAEPVERGHGLSSGERLARLLLPYPILLLGLIAMRQPNAWLLLVPIAVSGFYTLILPQSVARIQIWTWAEMQIDDPVYRFRSWIHAEGGAAPRLRLPPASEPPVALDAQEVQIDWSLTEGHGILRLPEHLLAHRRMRIDGVADAPFQISMTTRDAMALATRHHDTHGPQQETNQADTSAATLPDALIKVGEDKVSPRHIVTLTNHGPAPLPSGWLIHKNGVMKTSSVPSNAQIAFDWERAEQRHTALPVAMRAVVGPALALPLADGPFADSSGVLNEEGWLIIGLLEKCDTR